MQKIRQTVDTSEADRKYVAEFEKQVVMLCGMAVEMFEEHKHLLLSPVMRELMLDKAKEVAALLAPLRGRLVADNPYEDFKKADA